MSFGTRPQTPDDRSTSPTPARKPLSPEMADAIQVLDARRSAQVANQVAAINRLLQDGSYDKEMEALHAELAKFQAAITQALGVLESAQASFKNAHVLKMLAEAHAALRGEGDE